MSSRKRRKRGDVEEEEELESLDESNMPDVDEMDAEEDEDSEGEEGDDEQTDEEEESSEEEEVGIATELPKRSTRGSRYASLVGEAMEQDGEFWGHKTWEDEDEDAEYNCSEGEERYKDIVDSDFDEQETEDDEEEDDDENAAERDLLKKKNVYVDPSLLAKKKAKAAKAKARTITKKPVTAKPQATRTMAAGLDGHDSVDGIDLAAIPTEVKRSKRATTKQKTEAMLALEKEREQKKVKLAERRVRAMQRKKAAGMVEEYREPTQEEHLAEARLTEQENIASLKCLQAWEEERKRYSEYKRQAYKGHYDIYVCWASDRLIITEEEEQGVAPSGSDPILPPDLEANKDDNEVDRLINVPGGVEESKSEQKTEAGGKVASKEGEKAEAEGNDFSVPSMVLDKEKKKSNEDEIKIPKKKKPAALVINKEQPKDLEKIPEKTTAVVEEAAVEVANIKDDDIGTKTPEVTTPEEEEEVYAKELLIFTDGKLPEIYSMSIVPRSSPPVCAVTGQPAHYFDPLTRKYYSSRESFRILRQWHNDQRDKEMYHEFDEIEKALLSKRQQVEQVLSGLSTSYLPITSTTLAGVDSVYYGIGAHENSFNKMNTSLGSQESVRSYGGRQSQTNNVTKTGRSGSARRK